MIQIPSKKDEIEELRKEIAELRKDTNEMRRETNEKLSAMYIGNLSDEKKKIIQETWMSWSVIPMQIVRKEFSNWVTRKKVITFLLQWGFALLGSEGGKGKQAYLINTSRFSINIKYGVETWNGMTTWKDTRDNLKLDYEKEGKYKCNFILAMMKNQIMPAISHEEAKEIAETIRKFFTDNGEPNRMTKDYKKNY